jgi:Rrf2 family protein
MPPVITRKYQYALRAVFELAKHTGKGPTKISAIAAAQSIPPRFLEVILSQLKGSGLVDSKRGFYGGYFLTRSPEKITVGEIFRFLVGSSDPAQCVACVSKKDCPFDGRCAFAAMWEKVTSAINSIYNETTIKDLLENEDGIRKSHIET